MDEDEQISTSQEVYAINLPRFQRWSSTQVYDYAKQIADYDDLQQLGAAINAARVALFRIADRINDYERKERAARVQYDRAYRRAYLESSGKTEAEKKMSAALACENLENTVLEAEQLKNELNRVSHALRLELQTLQTVGHNLRQQMKMD